MSTFLLPRVADDYSDYSRYTNQSLTIALSIACIALRSAMEPFEVLVAFKHSTMPLSVTHDNILIKLEEHISKLGE